MSKLLSEEILEHIEENKTHLESDGVTGRIFLNTLKAWAEKAEHMETGGKPWVGGQWKEKNKGKFFCCLGCDAMGGLNYQILCQINKISDEFMFEPIGGFGHNAGQHYIEVVEVSLEEALTENDEYINGHRFHEVKE